MNAFPQDDTNQSAISELHSILEESSIQSVEDKSILPDDYNNTSFADMRQYFEGMLFVNCLQAEEIKQLEARVVALQQSLASQKEETEMIRQERDELQNDVSKLEEALSQQQTIVQQLEKREEEKGQEVETKNQTLRQEIADLQRMNETLSVSKKGRRQCVEEGRYHVRRERTVYSGSCVFKSEQRRGIQPLSSRCGRVG